MTITHCHIAEEQKEVKEQELTSMKHRRRRRGDIDMDMDMDITNMDEPITLERDALANIQRTAAPQHRLRCWPRW